MTLGPIQYVVFGVRTEDQQQEVVNALRTLGDRGLIRVIDLAFLQKKDDGSIVQGRYTGLSEEEYKRYGTIASALIGFGAGGPNGRIAAARQSAEMGAKAFAEQNFGVSVQELREQIMDLTEDMPPGSAFAIALIEHQWAIQLKEKVQKSGVAILSQGLVRPRSLVMLGAELAAAEQAAAH